MTSQDLAAKVVLVDIEGTTTSIRFVHDILFPYAKANAARYLSDNWATDEIKQIVKELKELPQFSQYALSLGTEKTTQEILPDFINYLIINDLKVTPLKTLQGLIWDIGYTEGVLKGHVYADVAVAFQTWQQAGLQIAVYSSGSVEAQKLLFGHSIAGNLLPYLSAHFDTHVGHKQQQESYTKIAQSLQVQPEHVLFLTDIPNEAAAARAAGMLTMLLQRPGNALLSEEQKRTFTVIDDFTALETLHLP